MLHFLRGLCAPIFALVLALAASSTRAQEIKPIVKVSITTADELLADGHFLESINTPGKEHEFWGMVRQIGASIDRTKPAGAILGTRGTATVGLAYVPVASFDQALATVVQLGYEVEDKEDGIKQIGPVFLKENKGYAFAAQDIEHLKDLPDPATLIGEASQAHDVAINIHLQNVPALYQTLALGTVKGAVEGALQRGEDESEKQFELRKQVANQQIKMIEQILKEVERVTLGLNIDREQKKVSASYQVVAVAETPTAEQFASMQNVQSRFTSLNDPAPLFSLTLAWKTTDPAVQERIAAQMDAYRAAVMQLIDQAEQIESDEERAIFKELAGEAMSLLRSVALSAEFDMALLVKQEESGILKLLAGLRVPDGNEFEAFFRKVVNMAVESEPEGAVPPIRFNAVEHQGARLHVMLHPDDYPAPLEGEDVKLFGPKPGAYFAFSKEMVWLGFGSDLVERMKQLIDDSQQGQPTKPVRMQLAISRLLAMDAASGPQNASLQNSLKAIELGTDRMSMEGNATPRSVEYKFELNEAFLKMFRQAVEDESASEEAVPEVDLPPNN